MADGVAEALEAAWDADLGGRPNRTSIGADFALGRTRRVQGCAWRRASLGLSWDRSQATLRPIRNWRPHVSRNVRLSLFAPVLLSLLAACGGAAATPASTDAPSPSPGPQPSFEIKIAAPLSLTWASVPGAVTSFCDTPATGAWSFRYTAAAERDTPYLDIQLVLPSGSATVNGSGDFRIDLSPGESTGLPVYMADPIGLLSGNHGTSGTVSVSVAGSVARILIDGIALGRGSTPDLNGLQAFTMDLACPTQS